MGGSRHSGRRSAVVVAAVVTTIGVASGGVQAADAAARHVPRITSVSPARTAAGKAVVITGTGFTDVSRVRLRSMSLRFHVRSSRQIAAVVPAGATSGRVVVVTGRVQAVSPKPLTVAASVSSISPTSGGLHTVVTVNGSGFTAPATVTFNGVASPATVVSATKLTVLVPAGASTGPVTVTSAGSTVAAGTFTVTTSIVLTSTVGPPTTSTYVYGSGFGANELVDLYFGLTDVAVVATTGAGTFTYPAFVVPASAQPGTGWISVQGRHSGLGAQAPFVVRTNWTQLGYKSSGGRFNAYENTVNPSNVGGLGQSWSYSDGTPFGNSVTVSGGLAYLDSYSKLSVVDATTGALRWTYSAEGGGSGAPAVANGIVYAGTRGGMVYALNATTGALIWSVTLNSTVESSPVVSGGIVYFGANDGNVYALNATTGAQVWTYLTGGGVYSSPMVSTGIVYVGSADDYIYALNAASGALVWRYETGGEVQGDPAVVNGLVYIGSVDDTMYALNAGTGSVVWSVALGAAAAVYGSPAVANGLVYIGSENDNVYALNATTGAIVWTATTNDPVTDSVTVANGVVYTANSYGNTLYALDASYGGILWTYTAGAQYFRAGPTLVNGTLYAGSNDGRVNAFTLAAGLNPAAAAAHRPALRALHPNRALRER